LRFNCDHLRAVAKKNYIEAWICGGSLIKDSLERNGKFQSGTHGKSHALYELINKLRNIYLDFGFTEVILPMAISEDDIRKQTGPEAVPFMDIMYSLATNEAVFDIDDEANILRDIFARFKSGSINGDSVVGEISQALRLPKAEIAAKLEKCIKRECKVSSFMLKTDGLSWLPFLGASSSELGKLEKFRFFNIDCCFRRERVVDKLHSLSFHTCQSIIGGEEVSMSAGKDLVKKISDTLGIEKIDFLKDIKESMYYAPNTQYEIFASADKMHTKEIEIGTIGILSPIACAEYSIDIPVLNVALCAERLNLILQEETKDKQANFG